VRASPVFSPEALRQAYQMLTEATERIATARRGACRPLGKLRNDRYVPLHPQLVEFAAGWTPPTCSTSVPTTAWSPITAGPWTATRSAVRRSRWAELRRQCSPGHHRTERGRGMRVAVRRR
jgi:hypothetical protein